MSIEKNVQIVNNFLAALGRRDKQGFMSTSPMGANKPIEDIEASLLATTKSALDELVWWAHATMAAKAA